MPTRDGRLLALDCEATVDSGAYSAYPFSACLEAAQIGSILPGPYDFPHYRCRAYSVATNKPPILPYRGVARTGVCFALEVTLDALARKLGIEPDDVRFKSLVRPEQMPFDNIAKRHFDSGDYPEALRRAVEAIGLAKVRARQQRGEPDGRRIGVGFAMFSEQGATAPASTRPGASRWCRATSRRMPASRRTARWNSRSARTATARASRPRWRRWRTRSSACRTTASAWCTATPPRRPTPPAPGARAAWSWRAAPSPRRATSLASACSPSAPSCCRPSARTCGCDGRRGGRPVGPHRRRRRGAHLVPPAAGPARRRRSRRAGGHRRLQGQARHRHLQLCGACRRRRRRYRRPGSSRSSTTSWSRTAARWSTP